MPKARWEPRASAPYSANCCSFNGGFANLSAGVLAEGSPGRALRPMRYAEKTDGELVASCRAGEGAAWAELVERFSRYVYAVAVGVYRLDTHDAEDVFQEVFARTYEHLDRLRDDAAIRPWIGQLARRLCIDRLRMATREQVRDPIDAPDVEAELERLEEALDVREALAGLPEHCRTVLDRFFTRDESYRTIAAALGIPAGTVASRISRCLGRLREALDGSGKGASSSRER